MLYSIQIDTPIGPMIALADEKALYLLEFTDQPGVETAIKRFRDAGVVISDGSCAPLDSIKQELKAYFEGRLKIFKTPLAFTGSAFQNQVWQALCTIPYGETRSYSQQASTINKPNAFRAVANANGANLLGVIVPCHRIIRNNGQLGGYGGGISRKQWLIDHEAKFKNT